ncbi:MAG: M48 family metallopeptidase [Bacteroidota bacterium]|nr:M48 family metallopeptidase [Bacteroidota bacterium]
MISFLSIGWGIQDQPPTRESAKIPLTQSVAAGIYQSYLSGHKILTQEENPNVNAVNRISGRLIAAVKKYYQTGRKSKELEGFHWECHLILEKKEDAWCLPGGKMVVYSSLLNLTQSDAALAVVLAHEIAHILLQHGDARMQSYLRDFLYEKNLKSALSAKKRETLDFFRMAYGNGDYVGVIRGFSPKDEQEADELGAIFCGLAGYHPKEAIVFWERMSSLRGTSRQPILISTHPIDPERIPKLRLVMDQIVRTYYTSSELK